MCHPEKRPKHLLNTLYCHPSYLPTHPPPTLSKHLLNYFLSLYICLFWTFHINGIIWYVFLCLCDWHLLLSILFSGFICVLYIPFYCWIVFYCIECIYFVYPFISWWTFGLFLPFWLLWYLWTVFVWTHSFISLGYIGLKE